MLFVKTHIQIPNLNLNSDGSFIIIGLSKNIWFINKKRVCFIAFNIEICSYSSFSKYEIYMNKIMKIKPIQFSLMSQFLTKMLVLAKLIDLLFIKNDKLS